MNIRASSFVVQISITVLMPPILCLAQSQTAEKRSSETSGLVLRADDGRPIRHARVDFLASSTGWAASTLTDDGGKFGFTGLSQGRYQVIVTAPEFQSLEATVKVDGSVGPVLLRLHEVEQLQTPRNDSVVSVQELEMSDKAEAAFAKGTRLLLKGDAKRSVHYFQRAIAKDATYYRAYHNLGLAHYQLGQKAQAEQDFQKSIDLTNGGYAPSQFALGVILCEDQEFRQAERLIENGLVMEPGSAVGKYFLGLVQFALHRPAEAEKSARAALWRNADEPEVHILLAKIHEGEHNPYAVIIDVAAYSKMDPHGPLESEASKLLQRAQQEISQRR